MGANRWLALKAGWAGALLLGMGLGVDALHWRDSSLGAAVRKTSQPHISLVVQGLGLAPAPAPQLTANDGAAMSPSDPAVPSEPLLSAEPVAEQPPQRPHAMSGIDPSQEVEPVPAATAPGVSQEVQTAAPDLPVSEAELPAEAPRPMSALERQVAQKRAANLEAAAAPAAPVLLIERFEALQADRQLEGVPSGLQEGLAAELRGMGASDVREIVLALYVRCAAAAEPCITQHTVLLSSANAELLEWALESEHAVGARIQLSASERAPIVARGGEGWHLTRIRLARSEDQLP